MNLAHMMYSPEDLLKALGIKIDNLQKEIDWLRAENRALRDKHYKDTELATMQKKYLEMQEDLHRGFPISKEEKIKIQEFKKAHPEENFQYVFVPTPIGVSGKIIASNGDKLEFQEIG